MGTGGFPSQKISDTESFSMSWRFHQEADEYMTAGELFIIHCLFKYQDNNNNNAGVYIQVNHKELWSSICHI